MTTYRKFVKIVNKHYIVSMVIIFLVVAFLTPVAIQLAYQFGNSHYKYAFHTDFGPEEVLGYLGNIIGPVATFVALYITLKHEKLNREEDSRMHIRPQLSYSVINDATTNADLSFQLQPLPKELDVLEKKEFKNDINFKLEICNFGLNTAFKLNVLEIGFLGVPHHQFTKKNIKVEINDKVYFSLSVFLNVKERLKEKMLEVPLDIKLAYVDLNDNYYEQDVRISCKWKTYGCFDKPSEYKDFFAEIEQQETVKAQYYDDRTIEEEISKRLYNSMVQHHK